MNIFIVYAHPEPRSFDNEMKHKAIDVLTQAGHAVQVSDLYAMRFKAVMDSTDFTRPVDQQCFNPQLEQQHAAQTNTFIADIQHEQHKLIWAELVVFQFPMWWYSAPAIVKGWIDRVLAYGFAYGSHSLRGRRAMLVVSTGGQPRPFTPEKRVVVSQLLDHIQRSVLYFCGLDVLPPYAVYGAVNATQQQREHFMLQYVQLLRTIDEITPLDFDAPNYGLQL